MVGQVCKMSTLVIVEREHFLSSQILIDKCKMISIKLLNIPSENVSLPGEHTCWRHFLGPAPALSCTEVFVDVLAFPKESQDHRNQCDWTQAISTLKILSLWGVETIAVSCLHPTHAPPHSKLPASLMLRLPTCVQLIF